MDWVWPSWTQRVLLERLVSSRLFCCFGVDAHERLLMCHTLSMWYRVNTLQSACDIELTHSAGEIHSRCFSRLRGLWWTSDLNYGGWRDERVTVLWSNVLFSHYLQYWLSCGFKFGCCCFEQTQVECFSPSSFSQFWSQNTMKNQLNTATKWDPA